MTQEKKQSIKKWGLRVGTGALAFIGGLAATFFLVPGRVNVLHFDQPEPIEIPTTHFSGFVNKVMNAIDVDSDETMEGVVGSLENLKVEWPDKLGGSNYVTVNGSLALSMRNLNDFDVTLDLGVDYNERDVNLAIGYTGQTFYLALQDMYIKSSYVKTRELMDKVYNLFFNDEVEEGQGLGITVDIDGVLDSLIGGLDLSSLLSGGLGDLGISFGEEKEIENNIIDCPLSINLGEGKEPIELSVYLDKDTNNLRGANLKKIEIGDVKISGTLKFDIFKDHKVYGLDDERYDGYTNFTGKNFIEVINYQSWFDDIFKLLNTRTVGLDLSFSADQDDGTGAVNIGTIDGGIDVDASKFNLFDYIPKIINGETFNKESIVRKDVVKNNDGEETVVETILDNLNAGIDLSVSRASEHYADLNLTYAEQCAYLSFNEDAINAKMDIETLNFVISQVTTLIEGDPDDEVRKIMKGEPEEPGLFDFITSSELITAIKYGHYEGIIDVLEEISNSADGITLKLDLSSLGLGANAKVELTLDATDNGTKGVTSIKCDDIQMKEGIFDLDLAVRDYKQETIQTVLNNKDNYQPLDFAVGVFDQVNNILDTKKAAFSLEGSLKGAVDGLGMSFSGEGQLDYGEKYGFGNLLIQNYKNPENTAEVSENHPVKLYVDNTSNDKQINDMKLVYGQNEKLKGKLSVQSLEDIIKVVMKVLQSDDRRFSKFSDSLNEFLIQTVIGQVFQTKDYLQLAKKSFVDHISQNIEGTFLEIELSKTLLGDFLNSNLVLRINFEIKNEVKQIKSIEICDLELSDRLGNKVVNFKITLNDFVENKELPIKLEDTYMDFSSLATLLEFAIDSTELNSYHLTAHIDAKLGDVITLLQFDLDFYVEVIGENTRVYGKIPNIPYVILASNDIDAKVNTEFLFEPAKHANATSTDSIGGFFHIIRNEKHDGWTNRKFEQYYYRATSGGFVDNIAQYLLASMLDFKTEIVDTLGKINLESTKTPEYEAMFNENGFVDKSNPQDGAYKWDLDLNLGALTGIEAFTSLKASLSGQKTIFGGVEKSYLNKLVGTLNIGTTKAKIINISATIELKDIHPEQGGWKTQFPEVDERYETICGFFNSMSQDDRDAYVEDGYQDNPKSLYKIKLDTTTPAIFG